MKRNMGVLDRTIRVLIAAAVAALVFTNAISGAWAIVLMILAGVLVVTSLVSFCPLYAALGCSTFGAKK
ncbi:MAG TPA: DUF2892 domain-containing protein [Ginsengibacter sp.]|nr:DUF2892 domain-containing protein [Ginsengibacter sp.]